MTLYLGREAASVRLLQKYLLKVTRDLQLYLRSWAAVNVSNNITTLNKFSTQVLSNNYPKRVI